MLEDLEWVGFEWDEQPVRQSARFDRYRDVIDDLFDEGLLYPSRLSRREIREAVEAKTASGKSWPTDPDGVPFYPGDERLMSLVERAAVVESAGDYALRLDLAATMARLPHNLGWDESGKGPQGQTGFVHADPAIWGDVVLARKDVPASFHLCATLDDASQGVTHIVRGCDLFWATVVHRVLQEVLQLQVPQYHHHKLILDEDGRKLSKRSGDIAIRQLREAGMARSDIRRMIGLP